MEITINKVTEEKINIEDGFYTLFHKDSGFITAQVSVKGEKSMRVDKDGHLMTVETAFIFQNYHMVMNEDDTKFREELQGLSALIEKYY